ncbi:MAG: H+-translocating [NiFe] hydrogenase complex, transmembrane subunit CooM [Candidatus Desulfovibrio kirbyi]|uniref:H+-translocating [NiFe] hydrogenase complex, transmembrane subunit CooM n=1 Tax=Candidatus Desulfovibrio kirbyi TaxID=2696086 RepID=A0A6L2R5V3_9BACT|nr:MAG: H+-translocating [NiFe] hydrogenase complex, transmembrane subunit CooM [Candidatus Desulfovibrio kirbyi]
MSSPLFQSDGNFLPLLAGIALLAVSTAYAVLQRKDPRRLILWGALHDAGIVCLAISAHSATAYTGIWLYVIFQLIARSLALRALAGITPSATYPDQSAFERLRGSGNGTATGALFALGLLAAVGGSPFLVPEGRALIVKALLHASDGGMASFVLIVFMAVVGTVFIWLSVDMTRHIVLEKPVGDHPRSSIPILLTVLAVALALLGFLRNPLTDFIGRGFSLSFEHAPAHPAYWCLYLCALAAGALSLLRKKGAARMGAVAFALALILSYTVQSTPLTRLFLIIITLIGLIVSVYSLGYIHGERRGWYYFFLPLTFASLAGIVSAPGNDALYGYWELMTFASYFLVAHESNRTSFDAALKYYVICAGGALFMLPGLFLLEGLRGGLPAGISPVWIKIALTFCLAGFAAKAGLVPLHSWLPDAHPAAPSSVSGPLSGVITKMGLFGIVSVVFVMAGEQTGEMPGLFGLTWFGTALVSMGTATLIYGEIMALLQSDIKRMLAYSTLGQIGEITLVLGLGTWLATTGALWHVLNHAVMKDLLFLGAGALIVRTGSRNLADMKGLGRHMPWTVACMCVGLVSIMGLPPFGAFYSKYLMIQAAANAGQIWLSALILAGSLAGAIYYSRILKTLVFEERPAHLPVVAEAPLSMRLSLGVLAALSLLFCLVPQLPMNIIVAASSLCFEPILNDVGIMDALSVPWPIYVIVPIFGALLPALFTKDRKKAGWSSVAVLLFTALLVLLFGRGMDMLSYCFALIVPLIGALNMAYAVGYMEHSHTQWRFYGAFTCMCGALVGMAASRYLLSFFLFWEIMSSWTLYMAIAHEGTTPSLREAFKYFFFNLLGAGFLFVGICVLGPLTPFTTAVLDAVQPELSGYTAWLGMALLAVGFVMKAAQLPLRIDWQMHPALAPTPVSGYISSVLLKSAIVGLVKLFAMIGGAFAINGIVTAVDQHVINIFVMWIGGFTIIYSAVRALQVNGLKLIFIYSTVSQLGYMVLAVGAGGNLGWAGGLLHVFNHIFFKDLLFLICGSVMFTTHKESLEELGGIGRKMPFTLAVFAIGGLSLVGVPPTSGFSSKWLIYHALMQSGQPLLALLSLVGSVLTLAYVTKFLHAAFLGQLSANLDHVREAPVVMRIPMGILAFGCLVTGIFPGLALKPINTILTEYWLTPLNVNFAGVISGPGTWNATAISIMAALAFYTGRYFVRRFTRLHEIDVHTCGLPPQVASSRMGPTSIFGGVPFFTDTASTPEETQS